MAPRRNDALASREWRQSARLAIGLTVALRLGLGIVMGLAWAVARPSVAGLIHAGTYGRLPMPASPLGNLALGVWVRWDAVHHLNLAMRGYNDMGQGSTVFFPLFAGLIGALGRIMGGNFLLAGLTVSTVASALSLLFLIQLGRDLFGLQSGRWAAFALAVYPPAIFLIAPFSESLFLALTLGAFCAANRGRWITAAFLAALASLTRAPGVAAACSLAILGIMQWKHAAPAGRRPSALAVTAAVLAPFAGAAAFLAWRAYSGYPPLLEVLMAQVSTSVVDPVSGLALAVRQWLEVHNLPTTLDLLSALAFLGVTAAMLWTPRWRRPELLACSLFSAGTQQGRRC